MSARKPAARKPAAKSAARPRAAAPLSAVPSAPAKPRGKRKDADEAKPATGKGKAAKDAKPGKASDSAGKNGAGKNGGGKGAAGKGDVAGNGAGKAAVDKAGAGRREPAVRKLKYVKGSYKIPREDYALFDLLRERAAATGSKPRKNDLIRAGLHALVDSGRVELRRLLERLPPGK